MVSKMRRLSVSVSTLCFSPSLAAAGLPSGHAILVMIKKQEVEAAKLAEDQVGEQKSDKEGLISSARKVSFDQDAPSQQQQQMLDDIPRLERQIEALLELREYSEAIESLTKLMTTRKALLKILKSNDKDASKEKHETARTLVTFGKVLIKNGDPVNAERALRDAVKLFKKNGSPRDLEGVKEAQSVLATLNGVQL
jgi:hypothetical protein